jgi:hypothetical protein
MFFMGTFQCLPFWPIFKNSRPCKPVAGRRVIRSLAGLQSGSAHLQTHFVEHLGSRPDDLHQMAPRPGQLFCAVSAGELLAAHRPAQPLAFGAEADPLVPGRNVRVERDEAAGSRSRDARSGDPEPARMLAVKSSSKDAAVMRLPVIAGACKNRLKPATRLALMA